MKGSSRRPEQVAETLRQVITDALLRGEVRDPRVGFVTVTDARVTADEAQRVTALEGGELDVVHLDSAMFRLVAAKMPLADEAVAIARVGHAIGQ